MGNKKSRGRSKRRMKEQQIHMENTKRRRLQTPSESESQEIVPREVVDSEEFIEEGQTHLKISNDITATSEIEYFELQNVIHEDPFDGLVNDLQNASSSSKQDSHVNEKKTDEDRHQIEKNTSLQRNSGTWMELRRTLLTASNFSRVIKRRPDTPSAPIVKQILYPKALDQVASINHGIVNEKTALSQLALQENVEIRPCGLFLDEKYPFLGATPDGLCGSDTIVEVKCPITAARMGIAEAIRTKKVNFWLNKGGVEEINRNHSWFIQIQGQLHVTRRDKCLFGVWSGENQPVKTATIVRDDEYWSEKMEGKLIKFYMDCLLPEIIDPRLSRNMPLREPDYITELIEKKKQKTTAGSSH